MRQEKGAKGKKKQWAGAFSDIKQLCVRKKKKKAERKGIIQEVRFISLTLAAVPALAEEGLIATT